MTSTTTTSSRSQILGSTRYTYYEARIQIYAMLLAPTKEDAAKAVDAFNGFAKEIDELIAAYEKHAIEPVHAAPLRQPEGRVGRLPLQLAVDEMIPAVLAKDFATLRRAPVREGLPDCHPGRRVVRRRCHRERARHGRGDAR